MLHEQLSDLGLTVISSVFDENAIIAANAGGMREAPAVVFVKATGRGMPRLYAASDGNNSAEVDPSTVPHDALVFIESRGSLQRVLNTSGHPWSMVLRHLQMSPKASGDVRNGAWLRRCIRAVDRVAFTCTDGNLQDHMMVWKRGVQRPLAIGLDPRLDALHKAQALAELQSVVDEFWAGLTESIKSNHLGLLLMDNGRQIHKLGVSPSTTFIAERDAAGQLSLAPHSTSHKYIGEVHVFNNRVLDLKVSNSAGIIVWAQYDHALSRPVAIPTPEREVLWDFDDLDAFDGFVPIARSRGVEIRLLPFANFLIDLRQHGMGQGWEDFRWRPQEEVDAYLSQAAGAGRLDAFAVETVRWAIAKQQKELHPEDQKAFEAFRPVALTRGPECYPRVFAALLRFLRQHGQGPVWQDLCQWPDDARNWHLTEAKKWNVPYRDRVLAVAHLAVHPEQPLAQQTYIENAA